MGCSVGDVLLVREGAKTVDLHYISDNINGSLFEDGVLISYLSVPDICRCTKARHVSKYNDKGTLERHVALYYTQQSLF
jgi:hypothetical protein